MPAGEIKFYNGASVMYDDYAKRDGLVVFKTPYKHDVQVVRESEVKNIKPGEWHRTVFGSCENLTESEIKSAVEKHQRDRSR